MAVVQEVLDMREAERVLVIAKMAGVIARVVVVVVVIVERVMVVVCCESGTNFAKS